MCVCKGRRRRSERRRGKERGRERVRRVEGGLECNYSGNLWPEKQFINHSAWANTIQISLLAAVTGSKVHTACLCGFSRGWV